MLQPGFLEILIYKCDTDSPFFERIFFKCCKTELFRLHESGQLPILAFFDEKLF